MRKIAIIMIFMSSLAVAGENKITFKNDIWNIDVTRIEEVKSYRNGNSIWKAKKGTKLMIVDATLENISGEDRFFKFYHVVVKSSGKDSNFVITCNFLISSNTAHAKTYVKNGKKAMFTMGFALPENTNLVALEIYGVGAKDVSTNQIPSVSE